MVRLARTTFLAVLVGLAACGTVTGDPEPPTTAADPYAPAATDHRPTTSRPETTVPAGERTGPSTARHPVTVPDVVGLPLDEAQALLAADGIPAQAWPRGTRYPQDCGSQEGQYVEEQDPEPGNQVTPSAPGGRVDLYTVICASRQP